MKPKSIPGRVGCQARIRGFGTFCEATGWRSAESSGPSPNCPATVEMQENMESEPLTGVWSAARPTFWRRFGDLMGIATIGLVLVAVAGRLAWRGSDDFAVQHPPVVAEESPSHWVGLPAQGVEVTRQSVPGDHAAAVALLDRLCDEALQRPHDWVLSLAPSSTEDELLKTAQQSAPLPLAGRRDAHLTQIYPLANPLGRVGVATNGTSGNSAAAPRVICWGFVLSQADEGHTVWFARPRDRIARSPSQGPP